MKKFTDKNMRKILSTMLNDKVLYEKYYQVLTPNDLKPLVKHIKTNQLTFVLNGDGQVVIDDEFIDIKKDDVVYIQKNSTHSFIANSNKLELFHIHLPYEFIENDREVIKNNIYDE